jgi:hypothetical protein
MIPADHVFTLCAITYDALFNGVTIMGRNDAGILGLIGASKFAFRIGSAPFRCPLSANAVGAIFGGGGLRDSGAGYGAESWMQRTCKSIDEDKRDILLCEGEMKCSD